MVDEIKAGRDMKKINYIILNLNKSYANISYKVLMKNKYWYANISTEDKLF